MRKHLIVCNDQVIGRGGSGFWDDFIPLVPEGYRFVWAWNSPELMIVNVESH